MSIENQLKLIEQTNDKFLTEITEDQFLKDLENGAQSAPNAAANPAPESKPAFGFNQMPPEPPTATSNPGGPVNIKASEIVSGEVAVNMMDTFIPVVMVIVFRKFADLEVKKNAFKLTAAEKSQLAPLVEKCLEKLNISLENPYVALVLSAGLIYGSKGIEVINSDEAQPVRKKAANPGNNPAAVSQGYDVNGKPLTRKPGETRGRKPRNA